MKSQYRSLGLAALIATTLQQPVYPAHASTSPPPPTTPLAAPGKMLLALKYVSYREPSGTPLLQESDAQGLIAAVNRIYASCSIEFRLEDFQAANPREIGLGYRPSRMSELDPIRNRFEDSSRLVVISTGPWNREGGLGQDGANAWTMMPGDRPAGTVLEGTFARNVNLLAHELGHYLNLEHRQTRENLMNPVIYKDSIVLDETQCARMRSAAQTWRSAALRNLGPEAPTLATQEATGAVRAGHAPAASVSIRTNPAEAKSLRD